MIDPEHDRKLQATSSFKPSNAASSETQVSLLKLNRQQRRNSLDGTETLQLLSTLDSYEISKQFADCEKVGLTHVLLTKRKAAGAKAELHNSRILMSLWKPLLRAVKTVENSIDFSKVFNAPLTSASPTKPSSYSFPKTASQQGQQHQQAAAPQVAILCINNGKFSGVVFSTTGDALAQKKINAWDLYSSTTSGNGTTFSLPSATKKKKETVSSNKAFQYELQSLFNSEWKQLLQQTKLCAVYTPGSSSNRKFLVQLLSSICSNGTVIDSIPFIIRKTSKLQNLQEVYEKLLTVNVRTCEKMIEEKLKELSSSLTPSPTPTTSPIMTPGSPTSMSSSSSSAGGGGNVIVDWIAEEGTVFSDDHDSEEDFAHDAITNETRFLLQRMSTNKGFFKRRQQIKEKMMHIKMEMKRRRKKEKGTNWFFYHLYDILYKLMSLDVKVCLVSVFLLVVVISLFAFMIAHA